MERQKAHLSQYRPSYGGTPSQGRSGYRQGGPRQPQWAQGPPHKAHRYSPLWRTDTDDGEQASSGDEAETRSNGDRPTFHGCWSCGKKGHIHEQCTRLNPRLPHRPPAVPKCWSCGKTGHRDDVCPRPNSRLPYRPPSRSPSGSDSSRESRRGHSPGRGGDRRRHKD